MIETTTYTCSYCDSVFDTAEDCMEHERTHLKDYSIVSDDEIADELYKLSKAAWRYHVGNEVFGIPCENFISLLEAAADRIGDSE